MFKKILITGGVGYVGSVLTNQLLNKGFKVKVLDNLMHNQTCHLPYFACANFEFILGDIRDKKIVKESLKDVDAILHLAAIVGVPACNKNPRVAKEINVAGSRNINMLRSKNQPLIYASTGSIYGPVKDICKETTPINPQSLYGKTKAMAEEEILERGNSLAMRFATGFGFSQRLCLDYLLINDLVYQVLTKKKLTIYERKARRTFIHVQDMARSYIFAMGNFKKMKNQVFNVGSDKMNFTKEEIALKIKERVPYTLIFAKTGEDEDKRDYEVSYRKIQSLGFETQISMDDGINELVKGFQSILQ